MRSSNHPATGLYRPISAQRDSAAALALALLATLAAPAARAADPPVTVELEQRAGLATVRFLLPQGVVAVHLPDDLAAGETVSGSLTLALAPAPPRKEEKARAQLALLTVDVGGLPQRPAPTSLSGLTVCGDLACDGGGSAVPVRLRNRKGEVLAEGRVPVTEPLPPSTAYRYPPVGQTGGYLEIHGPFDGVAASTRLVIHGLRAAVVAESPRRTLVEVPAGAVGASTLELQEGPARAAGPFRALRTALRLGKPSLAPGERTTLWLEIQGLADLEEELPVAVWSRRPERALLEAGPRQGLSIHPSEVQPGGVYQWIGTVVGVTPGPVEIELLTTGSRPETQLLPRPPR